MAALRDETMADSSDRLTVDTMVVSRDLMRAAQLAVVRDEK